MWAKIGISWKIGISLFIIFLLWFGYWVIISNLYPCLGDSGQFGDTFGALNALFAGCAFAGLFWAIILQRNELRLQKKELELTRNEISGQKNQLEAQAQTLKKQNFDNFFFQLLTSHNNIVTSLIIEGRANGRACFSHFYNDLWHYHEEERNPSGEIDFFYEPFFKKHQSNIGYYFRHLYNMFKFIDQHTFLNHFDEKKYYTDLVRAQLSNTELGLLFYNCQSKWGVKFKPLVEDYSLLKGMDMGLLFQENHRDLYNEKAYGSSTG